MNRPDIADTVYRFLQDADTLASGPIKAVGGAAAIVGAAIWQSLTSLLAVVLAVLWVIDVALGLLKVLHRKGPSGFDWQRFMRAWVKIGASGIGIILLTLGDVLLQESVPAVPQTFFPLVTGGLVIMCGGFFGSALANLGYFFPEVEEATRRFMHKARSPDSTQHRRSGDDQPNGEE